MQYIRPEISTLCFGQAASAAAVLLAAGTPGKRLALPNARILIHQPYAQSYGQASDVELAAAEILRLKETLEDDPGPPHRPDDREDRHRHRSRLRDDGAEAKDYGIIDEVILTRDTVDNTGRSLRSPEWRPVDPRSVHSGPSWAA